MPGASFMPAEWAPHRATWLAFPHNVEDWPGRFEPIPWVYAEIIAKITRGERVELMVNDAKHERLARGVLGKVGVDMRKVRFHRFRTDRVWTRDMGPIFVHERDSKSQAIARFRFTGWAKYPNHKNDDRVPELAARVLKLAARPIVHNGRPVVLEGGSLDVNGAGTILTTEECLLHKKIQIRNPGFGRADYEQIFRDALGARHTIWLGRGIVGDDTHGHVDDLARFVNTHTIVLCREPNGRDANHRILEENHERLLSARLADGSKPNVVSLPMPAPVVFDGQRLPASYANFYICNAATLVPTFNDPNDRLALGILSELIPDRPVIGIHAVDLVWGLGTLHCLSQQQPAV